MTKMQDTIIKGIAGAVAGALLTWTASALTLTGRVAAIEASQARIESMVVQLVAHKATQP